MKDAFKIFSLIIITIFSIWVALSFVKYSDKSEFIKPITESILSNVKQIKMKKILTKDEIIGILEKSGCKKVYVENSNIVTAGKGTKYEITNHWFRAQCNTKENNLIYISITTNKDRFDIRTDIEHSYCFSDMNKKVNCYTQTLTTLPSR